MLSFRERYQREFPIKYKSLDASKVFNWQTEYEDCEKEKYALLSDHHIELIKSIKLAEFSEIESQISKFLKADAESGQELGLIAFLTSADGKGYSSVGLREWLKENRPDLADEICNAIYNKIIIPYAGDDPNELLTWIVKMERDNSELLACLQKANDDLLIASAFNLACKSKSKQRADIIFENRDRNAILDFANDKASRYIIGKFSEEQLQAYINSRCISGNATAILMLSKLGIPFNDSNWQSLCSCNPCTDGHLKIADIFLKSGATIPNNLFSSGQIADRSMQIYLAVKFNSLDQAELNKHYLEACASGMNLLAEVLLRNGADAHCTDENGLNSFTLATRSGNRELMKTLAFIHKVDVKQVYFQACSESNVDIVSTLKASGCITVGVDHPTDVNAIKIACINGSASIVKILLSNGQGSNGVSDITLLKEVIDPFDRRGVDTFFDAVVNPPDRAYPIDQALKDANETVIANLLDTLWERKDDNEGSIHHYLYYAKACHYGKASDIERMIVALNKPDIDHMLSMALHYNPNAQVLNYLLDHGANPTKVPRVLECACRTGDLRLIDRIFSTGVSPQGTELHTACREGHYDVVKFLIGKKIPINDRKNTYDASNGFTALEVAIFSGHSDIALLLLENGADVSRHPKTGRHPLGILFQKIIDKEYSLDSGFELMTQLLANGADPIKALENLEKLLSKDPEHASNVFSMMMQCTIAQIKDQQLCEIITENFNAHSNQIKRGSAKPEHAFVKSYLSFKSLVEMVNYKDSYANFVKKRDKIGTPDMVKKSFNIDKNTYHASLSRTAVILKDGPKPQADQLNQYLSTAVQQLVNVYYASHQSKKLFHMIATSKHAEDCQTLLNEFDAIDKHFHNPAEQAAAKFLFLQSKFCEAIVSLMERKKIAYIADAYQYINMNPKDHHYIRMLALTLNHTEHLMNLTDAKKWLQQPVMKGLAELNADYPKVYEAAKQITAPENQDSAKHSRSMLKKDQTISYKPLTDLFQATNHSITEAHENSNNEKTSSTSPQPYQR